MAGKQGSNVGLQDGGWRERERGWGGVGLGLVFQSRYLVIVNCTILTSDSELIDSTYMVTPTSTGGPETRIVVVRIKEHI